MKTKIATLLLLIVGACTGTVWAQTTPGDNPDASNAAAKVAAIEVLPIVAFEGASLEDVIKSLARSANINILFDPRVVEKTPEGQPKYPSVSIRLESVTAQNALEAILKLYGLRLELDPKTLITTVTIKDPAAAEPLKTDVIPLKFVNPSNVVAIIKPTLGARSQAIPDGRSSQLIMFATEAELIEVNKLVKQLDTVTRQVLIEAKILETLRNPSTIKGVNWAGTFARQNVYIGNNSYGTVQSENGSGGSSSETVSANPTVAPNITPQLMGFLRAGYAAPVAYLNADGARAVFSFFNTDTDTEVIATPRAVTTDNVAATLSVSRAVPIFNVTQGGTQTGNTVDITYTNLGVMLEVTPRISGGTNIALAVVPEVSDIEGRDLQVIDGKEYTANIFSIRRIKTQVLIPSGNTLVLGGLLSDNTRNEKTKVPILGDLPGMKYIFGSSSKVRRKGNLLIFVTPTVVGDTDFQPHETQFLKQRMPEDTAPDDLGSFDKPWDGVEPYDWNKPVY